MIAPGSGGSALPDFCSTKLQFAEGVPVDVRSLDAIVAEIGVPPPAVVEIDVEGTEDVVLEHAQSFLTGYCPDILCEILPGSNTAAVQAALAQYRYRYNRVERGALSPQPTLVPSSEFRDWLFAAKSTGELVSRRIPVA